MTESPQRRRWLTGPGPPLVVAVVCGALAMWQGVEPSAMAVLTDSSEYLAVSGRSGRGDEEIVWMLDTRRESLIAVGWDRTTRSLIPMGHRSIDEDTQSALRTR